MKSREMTLEIYAVRTDNGPGFSTLDREIVEFEDCQVYVPWCDNQFEGFLYCGERKIAFIAPEPIGAISERFRRPEGNAFSEKIGSDNIPAQGSGYCAGEQTLTCTVHTVGEWTPRDEEREFFLRTN